jgi:uncharacterized protein
LSRLFGTTPHNIKELFKPVKTIVVIGSSSNPYRTSNHIARYIQEAGFRMIPVNPNEEEVLGETCYDSIFDLPDELTVDIFDIFRNRIHSVEVVEEIIEWSRERGQKPIVWTQLNVSTPEAKKLAEKNGFVYIENRCLMVDHKRSL